MKKEIVILCVSFACILNANWLEKIKNDYNTTDWLEKVKNDYNATKNYIFGEEEDKRFCEAKINKYSDQIKNQTKASLFNYYMKVSLDNKNKILKSYIKLEEKGISSELKTYMPEKSILKFKMATSTLEYTNIILSELKRVKKALKQNDTEQFDSLIKQTEYLMFEWTTPFEVYLDKKIFNNSLLNNSNELYENIDKKNYIDYTKFIYSLIDNVLNSYSNTLYKIDGNLDANLPLIIQNEAILSLDLENLKSNKNIKSAICAMITDKLAEKVTSNLLYHGVEISNINEDNSLIVDSMIFREQYVDNGDEVNILNNPLHDSWYLMIREYIELQNDFYKIKNELDKIINVITVLPNNEKEIVRLKQDLFGVDALYRKVDKIARYNIIDLPISIYADLYKIKFDNYQGLNDDEESMADVAVAYNKACANMQQYMVSEFTIHKVIKTTKFFKKEFNDDEWEEIKIRAKLTQDWFNMLNKVKIQNK